LKEKTGNASEQQSGNAVEGRNLELSSGWQFILNRVSDTVDRLVREVEGLLAARSVDQSEMRVKFSELKQQLENDMVRLRDVLSVNVGQSGTDVKVLQTEMVKCQEACERRFRLLFAMQKTKNWLVAIAVAIAAILFLLDVVPAFLSRLKEIFAVFSVK